jgi:hypothetical protein
MNWRKLSFWRITLALSRGKLEWWSDPRRNKPVLRAKSGAIYEYRYSPGGYLIRRVPEFWVGA